MENTFSFQIFHPDENGHSSAFCGGIMWEIHNGHLECTHDQGTTRIDSDAAFINIFTLKLNTIISFLKTLFSVLHSMPGLLKPQTFALIIA